MEADSTRQPWGCLHPCAPVGCSSHDAVDGAARFSERDLDDVSSEVAFAHVICGVAARISRTVGLRLRIALSRRLRTRGDPQARLAAWRFHVRVRRKNEATLSDGIPRASGFGR